jgi:hypothetical protein
MKPYHRGQHRSQGDIAPCCRHVFDSPNDWPWAQTAALARMGRPPKRRRLPRPTWAGVVTLLLLGACLGVIAARIATTGWGIR